MVFRSKISNNGQQDSDPRQMGIVACWSLKEIEEHLQDFPAFLRVHYSYLINLNEVNKYVRREGGYLVMSDGSTVNISGGRKEALLKYF